MCIAIRKPSRVALTVETLRQCFKANPHGAGFAVLVKNKDETTSLVIRKGFFKFEEFYAAYKPYAEHFALIHFRVATRGPRDIRNCHPWEVRAGGHRYAIIHNGTLAHPSSAAMSDTGHFVKEVLGPTFRQNPDFPFTEEGHKAIGEAIGPGNKMVILRDDGRVAIINKRKGTVHEGVWFSNFSFVPGFSRRPKFKAAAPVCEDEEVENDRRALAWTKNYSPRPSPTQLALPAPRCATNEVDEFLTHRPIGEGLAKAKEAARAAAQKLLLDQATSGPKVHGHYSLPPYVHIK